MKWISSIVNSFKNGFKKLEKISSWNGASDSFFDFDESIQTNDLVIYSASVDLNNKEKEIENEWVIKTALDMVFQKACSEAGWTDSYIPSCMKAIFRNTYSSTKLMKMKDLIIDQINPEIDKKEIPHYAKWKYIDTFCILLEEYINHTSWKEWATNYQYPLYILFSSFWNVLNKILLNSDTDRYTFSGEKQRLWDWFDKIIGMSNHLNTLELHMLQKFLFNNFEQYKYRKNAVKNYKPLKDVKDAFDKVQKSKKEAIEKYRISI